jgi:hypothetical protein
VLNAAAASNAATRQSLLALADAILDLVEFDAVNHRPAERHGSMAADAREPGAGFVLGYHTALAHQCGFPASGAAILFRGALSGGRQRLGEGGGASRPKFFKARCPLPQHDLRNELAAARRADLMLDRGDLEGQTVWKRIRRVIVELQAPPTGPMH